MAGQSDGIDWTPYQNRGEAMVMLCRLIDRTLGAGVGIVWYAWGSAIVLRKPLLDEFGFGHSAVFQWHPVSHGPLPPPAPATEAVPATNFLTKFLTDKDNEHKISFGFDIIAIVATVAIAIPAAAAAGTAVAAVTVVALAGAVLCAILDGAYLALRYLMGGSVEEKKGSAADWDNNPVIGNLSVVGLVLTLPDFFVNGAATMKSIPKALEAMRGKPAALTAEVMEQQAHAGRLGAAASGFESRAAELAEQSRRANALTASRLQEASAMLGARAERIAQAAADAYKKGEAMQATLHTRIMNEMAAESAKFLAEKGSVVGTATATAYGIHDNPDKIDWVSRHMLTAFAASAYRFNPNPGSFLVTVGTSHHLRV